MKKYEKIWKILKNMGKYEKYEKIWKIWKNLKKIWKNKKYEKIRKNIFIFKYSYTQIMSRLPLADIKKLLVRGFPLSFFYACNANPSPGKNWNESKWGNFSDFIKVSLKLRWTNSWGDTLQILLRIFGTISNL
jgi:hypothetical protein